MASTLAQAIAQLEGYGAGTNLPTVANNPGDLSPSDTGATGNDPLTDAAGNHVTVFNDVADGWAALENKLSNIVSGNDPMYSPNATVQQFGDTYAGNSTYGTQLASVLGVDPSTPLIDVANSSALKNAQNITTPANNVIGGYINPATGAQINSAGQVTNVQGPSGGGLLSWLSDPSRVIVLVLGVVLFAAGLFAFKQTQVLIQGATKGVKTIAEASA